MSTQCNSGLDGVVVAQTEISKYDGINGQLIYRGGYAIDELMDKSFEEVAYLLWNGKLPTQDEANVLKEELVKHRDLNQAACAALAGLPTDADPMDALRTILSAQGARPGCPQPSLQEVIGLTAMTPTAIAAYCRHQQGLKPLDPRRDLDHAANFLYMLNGEEPNILLVRTLQSYLVLMADHGVNPSTFTACVVASTGSDLCSSIVAAIGTLKGPAHGGAVIAARQMVEQVGNPENAERFVLEMLDSKERLMGFGHREYRVYDPRARILRHICKEVNREFYNIAAKVEEVALRELLHRYPERPNMTNVDYYAGGVLEVVGIPTAFFTCIFAASRIVGWAAHVLEYMARDGRMISPTSEWIGPDPDKGVTAKVNKL